MFVEINIMVITDRFLKVFQNDYCSHCKTARNDYDSHFSLAFSLRDNSVFCGLLVRLTTYLHN